MVKEKQLMLTEEIIETAYKLLINKLAFGGIIAKNEAAFQFELGHILKTIGQLYEFGIDDKFHLEFETYISLNKPSIKSKSERARDDILIKYHNDLTITTAAIELKYFKKANHREPNNRYDVFKDISNLETYRENNVDLCYFILATDHSHYVNHESYSAETADFDFRQGSKYGKGTLLQYKTPILYEDIALENDYIFNWDKVNELYFLKLKI